MTIASHDGQVFSWDTSLDHALATACQMAGRNLSDEEWTQFLPTVPYQKVCPQFG